MNTIKARDLKPGTTIVHPNGDILVRYVVPFLQTVSIIGSREVERTVDFIEEVPASSPWLQPIKRISQKKERITEELFFDLPANEKVNAIDR